MFEENKRDKTRNKKITEYFESLTLTDSDKEAENRSRTGHRLVCPLVNKEDSWNLSDNDTNFSDDRTFTTGYETEASLDKVARAKLNDASEGKTAKERKKWIKKKIWKLQQEKGKKRKNERKRN